MAGLLESSSGFVPGLKCFAFHAVKHNDEQKAMQYDTEKQKQMRKTKIYFVSGYYWHKSNMALYKDLLA